MRVCVVAKVVPALLCLPRYTLLPDTRVRLGLGRAGRRQIEASTGKVQQALERASEDVQTGMRYSVQEPRPTLPLPVARCMLPACWWSCACSAWCCSPSLANNCRQHTSCQRRTAATIYHPALWSGATLEPGSNQTSMVRCISWYGTLSTVWHCRRSVIKAMCNCGLKCADNKSISNTEFQNCFQNCSTPMQGVRLLSPPRATTPTRATLCHLVRRTLLHICTACGRARVCIVPSHLRHGSLCAGCSTSCRTSLPCALPPTAGLPVHVHAHCDAASCRCSKVRWGSSLAIRQEHALLALTPPQTGRVADKK